MKRLLWLCIFQFALFVSNAQSSLDTLRSLLSKARANEDVKAVQEYSSQLAWTLLNDKEYDSALKYYNESLATIEPGTELELQGNIMIGLGAIYGSKGKFDSCILYYQASLSKFLSARDTANALIVESNLSIVYKNVGLYEESLRAALHIVSSLRLSDNSMLKGSCYNTIGSIYVRTKDFPNALEYYYLALENRDLNNQLPDVARIYNNIGELFILMRLYDSAAINLQRAATIKRELKDMQGVARTVTNLAKVSMLTKDFERASIQLKEVLTIQNNIDDPIGMIKTLNTLGELNILTNHLNIAELNLGQAEDIIRRTGTPDYLLENLELLVKLDKERRDFPNGLVHLEQLSAVRDTLLNQEKDRSMQAMQIRYETVRKEQQIAILEQREEINRNRIRSNQILITTLAIGLALVAVVGLLAYINFRNARSSRHRIELLLTDTRHRTKNYLQTLASIFHLQTRHYSDHNMVQEARSSESRVHAMYLLHEKFYSLSPGHTIDLQKYVTDLINHVIDIYNYKNKSLSLNIDIDNIHLDIDKALPLSLIIQELTSNAFKYAFDNKLHPQLTVSIKLNTIDDQITTIISDNGVGLNAPKTTSSQGFSLVEEFTAQLNGKLQAKTEKGATFIITFPLNPSWKKHTFLS
ncbi:MAG TPA: tetratricopeptide repeat protein [Cyclobacteriaceae bacterium]|nr:tetratricopeptide repeat protein [Cyclobacteriaceae bacterium]